MEQFKTGKLFVISGPSGTVKGTICKALLEEMEGRIGFSVSMTTRAPREGEIDGVNYFFKTREEFLLEIERGGLLEYAETYGNFYGTPRAYVTAELAAGRDVLLEIEEVGAMQVKKAFPEAVMIFILPPSMQELRRRLTNRGTETKEVLELRLSKALSEISYIKSYDYYVINDDLEVAVADVRHIMEAEHQRVSEEILSWIEKYREEL